MNHIDLTYGEKHLLVASSPSHQDILAHPLVSKSLAPKPTTLPTLPVDIPSPHLFQAVTKSTMPWVQRMSSQVGGELWDDACEQYSDVNYMWIKHDKTTWQEQSFKRSLTSFIALQCRHLSSKPHGFCQETSTHILGIFNIHIYVH